MKRASQLALARQLNAYVRDRTTALAPGIYRNPTAAYSDPARAQLERERLFRRLPLFAGMSCRVAAPGDYLAEEVAGVPLLLVRGADGVLGAFANICRHRGAPVADGSGNAKAFSCPYHGWTYALDGSLAGMPDAASFPGLDKAAHGLRRLPVGERHGMMFVGLAPENAGAIDVDTHLCGLGEELAAYGFDRYRFFAAETMTPAINWKFAVDTFLEAYHLSALHRGTVAPLLRGNLTACDAYGNHGRVTMMRFSSEEWNTLPEERWDVLSHIVPIYRLFPNSIVVFQSDHLETWRFLPGEAPDRCSVEFALFTPEAPASEKARRYWQKNYDLAVATVKDEDFALGERMQRGFMSGLQAEVTYGRNEPGLIQFHQCLRAALE